MSKPLFKPAPKAQPHVEAAPRVATVQFVDVRYAIWRCPGCGHIHREGKTEIVQRIAIDRVIYGRCGECGQRMEMRAPSSLLLPGLPGQVGLTRKLRGG